VPEVRPLAEEAASSQHVLIPGSSAREYASDASVRDCVDSPYPGRWTASPAAPRVTEPQRADGQMHRTRRVRFESEDAIDSFEALIAAIADDVAQQSLSPHP